MNESRKQLLNEKQRIEAKLRLAENENYGDLLLGIVRYTKISGKVWIDRGNMTDVLPGATVTLTDEAGSTVMTAVSGEDGRYAFGGLMPGVYRLETELPEGCVVIEPDDSRLAGNVRSVLNALGRCGAEDVVLTGREDLLRQADKVILPGVGDASVALAGLRGARLDGVLRSLTCPVLGICVGMQILCLDTEEGDAEGLGVFRTSVRRFRPDDPGLKVPHMGWNTLQDLRSPLFDGLEEGAYVYYAHSFYAGICPDTVAVTVHGIPFSAALRRDNFFGTQFHPEKSGSCGERILKNFLAL